MTEKALRWYLLVCMLVFNWNSWAQTSLLVISMTPEIKEVELYYGKTIMPAFGKQRLKLENDFSAADKKLLTDYRAKTAKLHDDFQSMRRLLPATDLASERARRRRENEQFNAIYNPADSLAEKYELPIRKLLQELEPQRIKWEAGIIAIQKKHQTKDLGSTDFNKHLKLLHRMLRPSSFVLVYPPSQKLAN